jgi:YD repeat-containing protein
MVVPVTITRDGKKVAEVEDSNAAFEWLLKHQGQSVHYALKHGGYCVLIEDPAVPPVDPESGFDKGTPYFVVYPCSGADVYGTKRHPTFIQQPTAEHNARKYSRDGRAYVIEHVDSDGGRSKVAEFRNGRKVRQKA